MAMNFRGGRAFYPADLGSALGSRDIRGDFCERMVRSLPKTLDGDA